MTKTEILGNAALNAIVKNCEGIDKQSIFVSENFADALLDEGQCFKHGDKLLFFRLNINVIVSKDLKRNIAILSSKQVILGIGLLMKLHSNLSHLKLMPKEILIEDFFFIPFSCLDRKIMEGRG